MVKSIYLGTAAMLMLAGVSACSGNKGTTADSDGNASAMGNMSPGTTPAGENGTIGGGAGMTGGAAGDPGMGTAGTTGSAGESTGSSGTATGSMGNTTGTGNTTSGTTPGGTAPQ